MKTVDAQQDCMPDAIKHKGIIKKMDEKQFYVSIISQSACASCHAKGVCNVSEISEEILEIPRERQDDYKVGDQVQVAMHKSLGTQAVFLGYILPFLMVIATLIISLAITGNEGISGLFAIVILVPYYFILNLQKRKLKRKFVFRIE